MRDEGFGNLVGGFCFWILGLDLLFLNATRVRRREMDFLAIVQGLRRGKVATARSALVSWRKSGNADEDICKDLIVSKEKLLPTRAFSHTPMLSN